MSCKWFIKPPAPCACCKREFEPVKIGVSAVGWAFGFDPMPGTGSTDWSDWKPYLEGREVVDEYGRVRDFEWFVKFVDGKEGFRRI